MCWKVFFLEFYYNCIISPPKEIIFSNEDDQKLCEDSLSNKKRVIIISIFFTLHQKLETQWTCLGYGSKLSGAWCAVLEDPRPEANNALPSLLSISKNIISLI